MADAVREREREKFQEGITQKAHSIKIEGSDRPKTFSAEYLAETNIRLVLPKTKKVLFCNFPLPSHFF
jgi:hypothetical protein